MNNPWIRIALAPILLAMAVVAAHLVPGLDRSVVENGIRNSLHVLGFAGVAALMYEAIPLGRTVKALLALVVAVLTGALAEYAQGMTSLTADITDLYRDAAGAGSYLAARLIWSFSGDAGRRAGARAGLRMLALVVGLCAFAPLAYWTTAFAMTRAQAPTILDFDSRWSPYYYHGINAGIALTGVAEDARNVSQDRFAEVTLSKRFRSGIAVATALHDWRPYSTLVFHAQITSGQPTALTVHINDYDHVGHFADTDAGRVRVTDSAGEFRIPIRAVMAASGRSDDGLSDIRQVVFLARDRGAGSIMRIDNIRLE